MLPIALGLVGIVLGGAALYFGLTASQQLTPLVQSIDDGSGAAARVERQLSALDTRLIELAAQNKEFSSALAQLRSADSTKNAAIKQLAEAVKSNRGELVKLAETMSQLAGNDVATEPNSSTDTGSSEATGEASRVSGSTYKIRAGDNFTKIAKDQGVSLQALLEANPNLDHSRLRIGQAINLPAAE